MEITEKKYKFSGIRCWETAKFESFIFWKTYHLKISQLIYISNHLTNISLKKKWSFPSRISLVNMNKQQFLANLFKFTKEILFYEQCMIGLPADLWNGFALTKTRGYKVLENLPILCLEQEGITVFISYADW